MTKRTVTYIVWAINLSFIGLIVYTWITHWSVL